MAYASQFTGGDDDSRRAEADRLLEMIAPYSDMLSEKESKFFHEMWDGREQSVSGKQLLWLRDIKDKLL